MSESEYSYSELGTRQIRLLKLEPSQTSRVDLGGSLFNVDISNPPPFDAVSYVWGSPVKSHTINCNGKTLGIQASCYNALSGLRHRFKPRTLWIDAVCINQTSDENSNKEKTAQIPLMGEIFGRADTVLIWFGDSRPRTKSLFKYISSISRFADNVESSLPQLSRIPLKLLGLIGKLSAKSMHEELEIFQNEWFERAWTVQEAVIAKTPRIVCGNATLAFDDLLVAINIWRDMGTIAHPVSWLSSLAWRIRVQRLSLILPDYTSVSPMGIPDMADIVHLLQGLKTTIPSDFIFSSINVFRKFGFSVDDPDYGKPCHEVFSKTARDIIEHDKSLKILMTIFGLSQIPGLPSWVPDWTIQRPPFISHSPKDHATKHSIPRYLFKNEGKALTLYGKVVDVIMSSTKEAVEVHLPPTQLPKPISDPLVLFERNIQLMLILNKWVELALFQGSSSLKYKFDDVLVNILADWAECATEADKQLLYEIIHAIRLTIDSDIHYTKYLSHYPFSAPCFRSLIPRLRTGQDDDAERIGKGMILNIPSLEDISPSLGNSRVQHIASLEHRKEFAAISTLDPTGRLYSFLGRMYGCSPFLSINGYYGVATNAAHEGDLIALFSGLPRPMVIRRGDGDWRLVGPAQIPGVMNGELWPSNESSLEEFVIT